MESPGIDHAAIDQLVVGWCLNCAVALHNPCVTETIRTSTRGLECSTSADVHHTSIGKRMCDIEHSRLNIDRAGIVEGDAGANVGDGIVLLVVGATVVKRAAAGHLVGKGIGIGKGAGIVEGAATKEEIVVEGGGIAAPGGIVGIHRASAEMILLPLPLMSSVLLKVVMAAPAIGAASRRCPDHLRGKIAHTALKKPPVHFRQIIPEMGQRSVDIHDFFALTEAHFNKRRSLFSKSKN